MSWSEIGSTVLANLRLPLAQITAVAARWAIWRLSDAELPPILEPKPCPPQ
jgi:hypothetical protein